MRVYAIGDIHGQLEMLRAAHDRIAADRAACGDRTAPVIHLGDLCDRGPETAGVYRFLLEGLAEGHPWHVLKGNHDRIMAGFLQDAGHQDPVLRADLTWLSPNMGGRETIRSYGVDVSWSRERETLQADFAAAVPRDHKALLDRMELIYETPDLIFVHAGIRPGVPLDRQDEDDLVWIRQGFLDDTTDHGRIVVHGHTVVDAPVHCGNRIALDTGAGYFMPLTAAVFEDDRCWVLTENGRAPLTPPF